jgi:hypothetical protein
MERILVYWRKKKDQDRAIGEVSWKELFSRGYNRALGIGIGELIIRLRILPAGGGDQYSHVLQHADIL